MASTYLPLQRLHRQTEDPATVIHKGGYFKKKGCFLRGDKGGSASSKKLGEKKKKIFCISLNSTTFSAVLMKRNISGTKKKWKWHVTAKMHNKRIFLFQYLIILVLNETVETKIYNKLQSLLFTV